MRFLHSARRVLRPCHCWTARRRMGLYVVLPEVPECTTDTNVALRWHDLPAFSQLTPQMCHDALLKRAHEFHMDMLGYGDNLTETETLLYDQTTTFDQALAPIETRLVPFSSCSGLLTQLRHTNTRVIVPEVVDATEKVTHFAHQSRFCSPFVHRVFRDLKSGFTKLTEEQTHLVDRYITEYRMNGLNLTGKDYLNFKRLMYELKEMSETFMKNIAMYESHFPEVIFTYDLVKDIPADILHRMSTNEANSQAGPWEVQFDEQCMHAFLTYCPSAQQRLRIHEAYCRRAGNHERVFSNHQAVFEIRQKKAEMARLLGFQSPMHLLVSRTMAGSISAVHNMIATLMQAALPLQQRDYATLTAFADQCGQSQPFGISDIRYWRQRHRRHVYGRQIEDDSLDYFKLDHCIEFLCALCADWFGIEFRDDSAHVQLPHGTARCLSVWERGRLMGTLFVDAYRRRHKQHVGSHAWSVLMRPRSTLCTSTPVCFLNMNLDAAAPAMSLEQIKALFERFGCCLASLLCDTHYSDSCAPQGVERDAVHIPGAVMALWLSSADNLSRLSRHHASSAQLSRDACGLLLEHDRHMQSFELCRRLYTSQLDMQLHMDCNSAASILQQRVHQQFMPVDMRREDLHMTNMTESLVDDTGGMLYARLWSQMVAADVWTHFEEALSSSEGEQAVRRVARRFRDTYLALGSSVHQTEVFRRFCGRDPKPDAFIRVHRLCGT